MSKTKHPANMVLLKASEHFVHISALLAEIRGGLLSMG